MGVELVRRFAARGDAWSKRDPGPVQLRRPHHGQGSDPRTPPNHLRLSAESAATARA